MNFQFNPQAAQKAEIAFIPKTGAYLVTIKKALWETSQTGAKALSLGVETKKGDVATLWLYYQSANGKEITFNINKIQAIMGCVDAQSLTHRYDSTGVDHAPELEGKQLGVLIQREEYETNIGTVGSKFNLITPFFANGKTYNEQMKNEPATFIKKRLETLRDITLENKPQPKSPTPAPTANTDFNDAIPF